MIKTNWKILPTYLNGSIMLWPALIHQDSQLSKQMYCTYIVLCRLELVVFMHYTSSTVPTKPVALQQKKLKYNAYTNYVTLNIKDPGIRMTEYCRHYFRACYITFLYNAVESDWWWAL